MASLDRPRIATSCEKNGAGNPTGHYAARSLGEHLQDYRALSRGQG